MLKKLSIFFLTCFLCACNTMPGMQNLDTSQMRQQSVPQRIVVRPIVVPITPSLLIAQPHSIYIYHVAPSDVLSISVWFHPEFSTPDVALSSTSTPSTQGAAGQAGYLVDQHGNIYFPLMGYVHVADKTIDTIRDEITRRLTKYIKNPQLNVRVSDFRGQKIYILGEILKPGFIPINDQPLTIADALAMSGSIDPNGADPRHIYVIRGDFRHPTIYWLNAKSPDALLLAEQFSLQPNDVLFVSSAMVASWNRILNQILPTVTSVFFARSIVR